MSKFIWLTFFLTTVFLVNCSEDVDPSISPNPEPPAPDIVPSGDENYLNLNSDYIYDQDRLHTFELTLSPENLAFLDNDPVAEEYVEGSLTLEGETISKVGIRYKGSIGAFVGCLSDNNFANPSGSKTCTKLSMKVKMNWAVKGTKFYGLKKLQFHSLNLDKTQMRDRLGYWLFGQMGVKGPRSTHARLVINGVYTGIYALVEQLDSRFTKYNWDDGDGNLYKEVWPIDAQGRAYPDEVYLDNLKTNEKDDPSVDIIRSFGQELENSTEETIQGVIAKWMNIDEIMSYIVVDRMIRADDGPFHWYCDNDCTNHNYYWYETPGDQKIHIVPWDLDHAFENIILNINPVTSIADGWGEVSADCDAFSYGIFGIKQRSAACDKLTQGWVRYIEEYEQKKLEFLNGPFAEDIVEAQLDKWTAQIRDATKEADDNIGDALSVNSWERAVDDLRSSLEYARNK